IQRCDVCRLALNDGDYPYILPLNFGFDEENGKITLYFHSALEGYKTGLFQRENRASFEMDCKHELQYFADRGYCTMSYESVIGRGRIEMLSGDGKVHALQRLMDHYHKTPGTYFNPAAIPRTIVYALHIEHLTGKRKMPKKLG
ncbi:MAG: pyridoxamine 5'-phosphate oxidase family protein, partial [Eubacteriales bacterium]|nr:pyridoxamine 5'-phosphate oxidase family protein [Eubacteriales bacterium]